MTPTKWWPQGTRQLLLLLKNKTANTQGTTKQKELNGLLVVHAEVRIGLTLYGSSCSTRYELNFFLGGKKKDIRLPFKKKRD
jgi:hypothetical protein